MANAGRRYQFVSRWTVDAPAEAASAAIHEVTSYPAWWPEVKETRKLDEDHFWMRTRSILPYDLAFDLDRTIADPRARAHRAARVRREPHC